MMPLNDMMRAPDSPRPPRIVPPQNDDLPFMGDRLAALHERPRVGSRWILWSCINFCIAALLWTHWARVEEFTTAEGKIVPASRLHVVQNLEGGILADISAQVGDVVTKGQELMRIDATRFSAPSNEGRERDVALQLRMARLSAETSGATLRVPDHLQRQYPQRVSEENALMGSRRHALQTVVDVLQQQSQQKAQELAESRARVTQLAERLSSLSRELATMRPLADQGAFSPVEVMRLERQVNDVQGELETARHAIPKMEAALREVRQRIDEASVRFRTEAMQELNSSRTEQRALSAANDALVDRVRRTIVRAPIDGVVNRIRITTPGGVIQPGVDLIDIVPREDRMFVEARVKPADIAYLHPGQTARIRLTAYDSTIYGSFRGVLEHVGADVVTPEPPIAASETYYPVRIRMQETALRWRDHNLAVLPGMSAIVDIRTGEKTVLDYLLKPFLKMQQAALRER